MEKEKRNGQWKLEGREVNYALIFSGQKFISLQLRDHSAYFPSTPLIVPKYLLPHRRTAGDRFD